MRALATSTLHMGKESFVEGNFTDAGLDDCFNWWVANLQFSAAELGVACENFAKVNFY